MKKVILALGFFAFFLFGAVAVQQISAATMGVEIVDFDKDPTKDGDKSKADVKKAEKSDMSSSKCSSSKDCCAAKTECCKSAESASKSSCEKKCPDKK